MINNGIGSPSQVDPSSVSNNQSVIPDDVLSKRSEVKPKEKEEPSLMGGGVPTDVLSQRSVEQPQVEQPDQSYEWGTSDQYKKYDQRERYTGPSLSMDQYYSLKPNGNYYQYIKQWMIDTKDEPTNDTDREHMLQADSDPKRGGYPRLGGGDNTLWEDISQGADKAINAIGSGMTTMFGSDESKEMINVRAAEENKMRDKAQKVWNDTYPGVEMPKSENEWIQALTGGLLIGAPMVATSAVTAPVVGSLASAGATMTAGGGIGSLSGAGGMGQEVYQRAIKAGFDHSDAMKMSEDSEFIGAIGGGVGGVVSSLAGTKVGSTIANKYGANSLSKFASHFIAEQGADVLLSTGQEFIEDEAVHGMTGLERRSISDNIERGAMASFAGSAMNIKGAAEFKPEPRIKSTETIKVEPEVKTEVKPKEEQPKQTSSPDQPKPKEDSNVNKAVSALDVAIDEKGNVKTEPKKSNKKSTKKPKENDTSITGIKSNQDGSTSTDKKPTSIGGSKTGKTKTKTQKKVNKATSKTGEKIQETKQLTPQQKRSRTRQKNLGVEIKDIEGRLSDKDTPPEVVPDLEKTLKRKQASLDKLNKKIADEEKSTKQTTETKVEVPKKDPKPTGNKETTEAQKEKVESTESSKVPIEEDPDIVKKVKNASKEFSDTISSFDKESANIKKGNIREPQLITFGNLSDKIGTLIGDNNKKALTGDIDAMKKELKRTDLDPKERQLFEKRISESESPTKGKGSQPIKRKEKGGLHGAKKQIEGIIGTTTKEIDNERRAIKRELESAKSKGEEDAINRKLLKNETKSEFFRVMRNIIEFEDAKSKRPQYDESSWDYSKVTDQGLKDAIKDSGFDGLHFDEGVKSVKRIGNVFFSRDFPKNQALYAAEMLKRFGIYDPVVLTTSKSVREGSKQGDSTYGTWAIPFKPGGAIDKIIMNDKNFSELVPGSRDMTFMHELGHMISYHKLANADMETKMAITKDFLNKVNKAIDEAKYKSDLESFRIGKDQRNYSSKKSSMKFMNLVEKNPQIKPDSRSKYLTSFSEYLADQFRVWGTTSSKPKTLADKFFHSLSNIVKNLFRKAGVEDIHSEYHKWLDREFDKGFETNEYKESKAESTSRNIDPEDVGEITEESRSSGTTKASGGDSEKIGDKSSAIMGLAKTSHDPDLKKVKDLKAQTEIEIEGLKKLKKEAGLTDDQTRRLALLKSRKKRFNDIKKSIQESNNKIKKSAKGILKSLNQAGALSTDDISRAIDSFNDNASSNRVIPELTKAVILKLKSQQDARAINKKLKDDLKKTQQQMEHELLVDFHNRTDGVVRTKDGIRSKTKAWIQAHLGNPSQLMKAIFGDKGEDFVGRQSEAWQNAEIKNIELRQGIEKIANDAEKASDGVKWTDKVVTDVPKVPVLDDNGKPTGRFHSLKTEVTMDHLAYLYGVSKNPDTYKKMLKNGWAGKGSLLDFAESKLPQSFKTATEEMIKYQESQYPDTNEVFRTLNGRDMPKEKNYLSQSNESQSTGGDIEVGDTNFENPSTQVHIIRDRTGVFKPNFQTGLLDTSVKWARATADFQNKALITKEWNNVWGSQKVKEAAANLHGDRVRKVLSDAGNQISFMNKPDAGAEGALFNTFKNIAITKTFLANAKPVLNQVLSYSNYAVEGGRKFFTDTKVPSDAEAQFKDHIDKAIMVRRVNFSDAISGSRTSDSKLRPTSLMGKAEKYSQKTAKAALLGSRAMDGAIIRSGGMRYIKSEYNKAVKNLGLSHEMAMKHAKQMFTHKTNESQQSANPMFKSKFQSRSDILSKMATMFTSTPGQYSAKALGLIYDIATGRSKRPGKDAVKLINYTILNSVGLMLMSAGHDAFFDSTTDQEKKKAVHEIGLEVIEKLPFSGSLPGTDGKVLDVVNMKRNFSKFVSQLDNEEYWNAVEFVGVETLGPGFERIYKATTDYDDRQSKSAYIRGAKTRSKNKGERRFNKRSAEMKYERNKRRRSKRK